MTTITRKQYKSDGSETSALGLPCETVTETFDGSISSDGVSIDDAFDVKEIDITDDHSTGVLSLVAEIANVQLQERLVPTDFTTPIIKGQPFKGENNDECDWDADEVTAEVEEVELTTPITVEGVPVKRLWKATGVSFTSIQNSAIMDGRSTMNGYSVDGASDVVYKVLPNNAAINALVGVSGTSEEVEVDAESGGFTGYTEVNELKYELLAAMAKKTMDSLCGLALVGVGENGGVMSWMVKAHEEYGIEYGTLASAYATYGNALKDGLNHKNYHEYSGSSFFYLDTIPTANTRVVTYVYATVNVNYRYFFGAQGQAGKSSCYFLGLNGTAFYTESPGSNTNFGTCALNTKYKVDYNVQRAIIDDGEPKTLGTTLGANTTKMAIGKCNTSSNGAYDSAYTGRIYDFAIYEGETLTHLYIPVADNKMFDLVTNAELTSSASNPFGTE